MHKFFTAIARFIASIFSIFFVITLILAIVLTAINNQAFNANLYKTALVEQNIYAQLPEIIGVALTSSYLSNPCAKNPLACEIDGASAKLQACLTAALGADVYQTIGSGQRTPTDAELQLAQPCLDQYGSNQTGRGQSGADGSGSGMLSFFMNLSAKNWQTILTILIPPQDLKSMTESTLDQLFAYLNGEIDTVTIPLDKLKARLMGSGGKDLIMQLIMATPACTLQDLEQIISGTGNVGMILCKPPEIVLPIFVSLLQEQLNSATMGIPDKAVIIRPPVAGSPNPDSGPFGADPISSIRTVRLIMRLSLLLPLIFLLLVTLFAVRTLKNWMRWWGIPFFISGVITLGLGIFALPALNAVWTRYILPRIPPYIPPNLADIGQALVGSLVHTITGGIILWGAVLLTVGLVAWIGSNYIKAKTKPALPEESLPPPV